jgi:hypothetical protein
LTEIYHLLGMKSSRDDLIDRMKTGWGCFVLASEHRDIERQIFNVVCDSLIILIRKSHEINLLLDELSD